MKTLVQFATEYLCRISPSEIGGFSHEVIFDTAKPVVTVCGVGAKTPKQATPLKYDIIDERNKISEIVPIFRQKPL